MIVNINMKICPECGRENNDSSEYCTNCGSKLSELIYEPRMNVMDNLRYALNIASSNFKVFYPTLIMIGVIIGLAIVMVLSIGLSFMGSTPESINSSWFGVIVFIALWLVMAYLGIVSIPAFQDVYKSAVMKVELDFRKSFDYGRSRFIAYLIAVILYGVVNVVLVFVTLMLVFIPFFEYSYDPTIPLEQFGYQMMLYLAPFLLIILPLMAVAFLSMNIMAWDNVDLWPAIKLTWSYIKKRWKDLLFLAVLEVVSSFLGIIPLGFIVSYALSVIINLALIDNYLSYQTTLTQEPQ